MPTPIASSAFEKKMNEQMSKGEVVFDSGVTHATSTPKLSSSSTEIPRIIQTVPLNQPQAKIINSYVLQAFVYIHNFC